VEALARLVVVLLEPYQVLLVLTSSPYFQEKHRQLEVNFVTSAISQQVAVQQYWLF
jgi:hypothetical protein